jgi:AraC-like DNA-binding protein
MGKPTKSTPGIRNIGYKARNTYELDIEILPAEDLRRRIPKEVLRTPERIGFYMFMCAITGDFRHLIDSEGYHCKPGSLLLVRPGQIQQYDADHDWTGWLVMFRPQFLVPEEGTTPLNELAVLRHLEGLPTHIELDQEEKAAICETIARMHADAEAPSLRVERHALIRMQLQALLVRLDIIQTHHHMARTRLPGKADRFVQFREAVETDFRKLRTVKDFAAQLRCSEKSLDRASLASVGMTAKAFIVQRIILEAKRLLIHSNAPISEISYHLGFDEPTNFGKFFAHFVGSNPSVFRGSATETPGQTASGYVTASYARL